MITKEQIKYLCEISKLSMDDETLTKYRSDMADIIDLMDTIKESEFVYDPVDKEGSIRYCDLRPDHESSFPSKEDLLKNSNHVKNNMFSVPKVFE